MKLVRFGSKGQEKPGALDAQGNIRDLSTVTADYFGDTVSLKAMAKLKELDLETLPIVEAPQRFGACLADVPNFHCVGLNYVNHAKETGAEIPKEPILFSKATSCLSGPNVPQGSVKTDWEVELGVVIGAHASHVSEADALSIISGYCIINDVSESHKI